jgi:hypothetical protein
MWSGMFHQELRVAANSSVPTVGVFQCVKQTSRVSCQPLNETLFWAPRSVAGAAEFVFFFLSFL